MREGYIVCNLTSYDTGYEIFGVYRTRQKAEYILKKIKKARYGNMTEAEISEWELENGASIGIIRFEDSGGKTYNINEGEK